MAAPKADLFSNAGSGLSRRRTHQLGFISERSLMRTGAIPTSRKSRGTRGALFSRNDLDKILRDEEMRGQQQQFTVGALTNCAMPSRGYVHHFCSFIENIDFTGLAETPDRDEDPLKAMPVVRGRVAWRASAPCWAEEWRGAQGSPAAAPQKFTLPGPMTIMSALCNRHYEDEWQLAEDLAAIINAQVRALVSAGCPSVQILEPALRQEPGSDLLRSVGLLNRCLEGIAQTLAPQHDTTPPDGADQAKEDMDAFVQIAQVVNPCCTDAFAISL